MTEPGDPSPHHVTQKPRKRAGQVTVADFTLLVRVPGSPGAVRVFTADEADEAAGYAAEVSRSVMALPLAAPAGYTVGADGALTPDPVHTHAGKAPGSDAPAIGG
ncbi:hypothetical protein [Mycolicibacterium sp. S3B2]|uniref:hypothetical protein n=1 Tax=Mycolicibacterium sp. S3B2 TaxID=3415120 RepID=UPI003C7CB719